MEYVITGLLITIGIILFTCTALQLIARNKTIINYQLALVYFFIGYFLIYDWLYQINFLQKIPFIMYTDISVSFFLGPVIYSYTKKIAGETYHLSYPFKSLIKYLPGTFVLIYFIFNNPGNDDAITGALFPIGHKNIIIVNTLSFLCDTSLVFYIILSAKIIYSLMHHNKLSYPHYIKYNFYFYLVSIFTFVFFFSSYFIENNNLIGIGLIINGLNSIYYFFFSYRYPEYTLEVIKPINAKNSKISLNNLNVGEIIENLNNLIEHSKVYRSPKITIQSLSNLLSIKTYELSLILNEHMNTNFRTLVNSNRIKDAQSLLLENSDKSVLEIAFEVGFNSKSSFHKLFSEETGLSPSEFRKKNKK